MHQSLFAKKSIIAPYLLFVSLASFADTYALDDTNLQSNPENTTTTAPVIVANLDLPAQASNQNEQTSPQETLAPEEQSQGTEQSNSQPVATPASNTLQLLDKLEALNLIATNAAYEHLNDVLGKTDDDLNNELDFSLIQTSPHELALTQVLSEICPPLLEQTLHEQFSHSYYNHLKLLMPSLDPNVVMPKINEHPEYSKILQGVREWTVSYPDDENRGLCIEFAQATFDEHF